MYIACIFLVRSLLGFNVKLGMYVLINQKRCLVRSSIFDGFGGFILSILRFYLHFDKGIHPKTIGFQSFKTQVEITAQLSELSAISRHHHSGIPYPPVIACAKSAIYLSALRREGLE